MSPNSYSGCGTREKGTKAGRKVRGTRRCVHGKPSSKAAAKLGAVIFAVIPLAKTSHGQVRWQYGGSYPGAWARREKHEEIRGTMQRRNRVKITGGFTNLDIGLRSE